MLLQQARAIGASWFLTSNMRAKLSNEGFEPSPALQTAHPGKAAEMATLCW